MEKKVRQCRHPTCGDTCRRTKVKTIRKPLPRPKKRIPKVSKKRKAVNQVYYPASKAMIEANPYCLINIEGVCTNFTQGVHHVSGKASIALLLNAVVGKKDGIPCCNACNGWIEDHSEEAKEMGLKVPDYSSKLSKFKK